MLSPGIRYIEAEPDKPSDDALRPDIAGFAGIFERGPVLVARRVEDWGQHLTEFGGFFAVPGTHAGQAYTPLALHGFFQNGGGPAVLFRLASRGMRTARTTVCDPATGRLVGLAAASPGAWGNRVTVRVPLRVTTSRVLHDGFAGDAATAGLRAGDIVRVTGADGEPHFGTLRERDAGLWLPEVPGLGAPLVVEVLSPDVEVIVDEPNRRERLRRLSLHPDAPNNLWRALERGRRGPEWDPELPSAWLPFDPELLFALSQQGPGASTLVRATVPIDGALWSTPSQATCASARTGELVATLVGGADALAGMDVSVVQSAIAALTKHPLPSILALPDLMLAVAPVATSCPENTSDKRLDVRTRPAADPRHAAPCTPATVEPPASSTPPAWPEERVPELDVPAYGPGAELLQAELLRAIWTTREGAAEKIAVLDPPPGAEPTVLVARARELRALFEAEEPGHRPATTGALFYPWIRITDPGSPRRDTVLVPPSGHVAGSMARTARESGAAARSANVPLVGAVGTERCLTDDERGELNAARLCVIRAVAGRSPVVHGARTLASERRADAFLPGARVLAFLRRALRVFGETIVFEPNDGLLAQRVRVGIELLMREFFRGGAFVGRTPDEAYRVQCDGRSADLAEGRVVAEIAVALAVPLEFITLRVAFVRDGSTVVDGAPRERG